MTSAETPARFPAQAAFPAPVAVLRCGRQRALCRGARRRFALSLHGSDPRLDRLRQAIRHRLAPRLRIAVDPLRQEVQRAPLCRRLVPGRFDLLTELLEGIHRVRLAQHAGALQPVRFARLPALSPSELPLGRFTAVRGALRD